MKYLFTILFFCSCTTTAIIHLDGSKSYDPDGYIEKYQWNQIGGYYVVINSSSSAVTTAKTKNKGTYTFELIVTDNQGATSKDTTKISYQ